jgi:hypothetical protein
MDQESAQELICGERHDLLLAAVIVFPAKRDSIIVERHQSMVGGRIPLFAPSCSTVPYKSLTAFSGLELALSVYT